MLRAECVVCGKELSRYNSSGRCQSHRFTLGDFPEFKRNTCLDCGVTIYFGSTRCKLHACKALAAERREARAKWCPPGKQQRYDQLRYRHGSDQAKTIMKAEAEKARLATMTPFERQLERVRNGAAIFERQDTSRAYGVTLGGVSSI